MALLLGVDYFYTLRDVIFFLEHIHTNVSEYRKLCSEKLITAVVEQDKQNLRNFLLGNIDHCPQIDLTVSQAYKNDYESSVVGGKRKIEENQEPMESLSSTSATPMTEERKKLLELRKYEIPAQTRSTVLTKPGAVSSINFEGAMIYQ